jgi:hypothetical protein
MSDSKTIQVAVSFPNPELTLRPGQYVTEGLGAVEKVIVEGFSEGPPRHGGISQALH